MTDNAVVVFVCTEIFALLALIILVPAPRQLEKIFAGRRELGQLLASIRNIERTLEQHRRVLNDAHKQITAVTKGLGKSPS